jgi:alkanesulfonate monooxygenase SsuD/methylene tetrahydromethanopterin reductase-like flavin-dependent oxidoreductase (luciferase family)
MWYGGASLRSAQWAGEHQMCFLTSSVVKAEESQDFAEIQLARIRAFRAQRRDGRRARVQILTDIATRLGAPRRARSAGSVPTAGRPTPARAPLPY